MPAPIIHDMVCIERDPIVQACGAIYQTKLSVLDKAVSDVYFIPVQGINGIAANVSGDGVLAFTCDPRADITAETADWADWDGSSAINLAATAFKLTSTNGVVTAKVNVKTLSY